MTATLIALAPVVAGFGAGHVLRRAGTADASAGRFLLLLNLYVCMPALVLRALVEVDLTAELAVFPVAAVVMVGTGYLVGRGVARHRGAAAPQAAVLVMGFMVVNCAFALPFVEALYGPEGVARLAAFDVVNNLLVLTLVYAVAARANPGRTTVRLPVAQLLRTPPVYAIALGLLLNVTGRRPPAGLATVVDTFAAASPFLIAVGTGILFLPVRGLVRRAGLFAGARLFIGLAVAALLVTALGLDDVDRGVLLLLGAAPLGFVIVTFASLEDLDVDLASQALALSLVASFALSVGLGLAVG